MAGETMSQKEMMSKLYDVTLENAKTLSRIDGKVETLQKQTDEQQQQINSLLSDMSTSKANTAAINTLANKVDGLTQDVKQNKADLEALKDGPGKTALSIWKKIGAGMLTALAGAAVTALVFLIKKAISL